MARALRSQMPLHPTRKLNPLKREDRDRLHILLKDLDETDRAAVIMRYWYDYSEIEIADSLNLTVSAVKSRLHRARRALAGMWQEDEHARLALAPKGEKSMNHQPFEEWLLNEKLISPEAEA